MDEEQPQKKITLNNFFEQIVEVNKVANAALTNSNNLRSQLNAVQLDLKRLVESLQVNFDSGVQNVQTQINEVTNVIVDDQRIKQSETDALEEQIFAQEDQLQKQTKGQKVQPTSEFGDIQKQNVADKSRSGLLGLGLLGGFSALSLGSNLLRKDKGKGNFFTNFFDKIRNFDGRPGSRETKDTRSFEEKFLDEGINDTGIFKNEKPLKERVNKISTTNITNNNIVNNNVVKEIIEEKKSDLVASTNNVPDDFDAEEHFKTIKFTVENNDEETELEKGPLKFFNSFDPENYKNTIEKLVAEHGEDKRDTITASIMQEVEYRKRELTKHPEYHPLLNPPGGYKTPPTMAEVNKAYELGVSLDSLKDGGTTIIEGNDEVVNENVNSGQSRGEVIVDTEIVKSSNSPVASIAIAEGNSLNNLAI
tara:strand:- start:1094 stop:2356 length:1263 start_codon:yes stop_codon:yes gene_type:complete